MRASVLRDEIVGERRRNLGGIPPILQLSCHFKKAINREDRRAAVHGVTKSRSQLND